MTAPARTLAACLIAVLTAGACARAHAPAMELAARAGVLDLRDFAPDRMGGTNAVVPLVGEWEFYPNELYDPAALAARPRQPGLLAVPGAWNRPGSHATGRGTGTYRLLQRFLQQDGVQLDTVENGQLALE